MPSPADPSAMQATGRRWAVATPHTEATASARRAFADGGNAIDAALAAAVTLAVTYPHMCGVGGDMFALVREPDGKVLALNASGTAPAATDPEAVRARHGRRMAEHGPDAITVPGAVSGWALLHRQGAVRPWGAAFEHALQAAQEGVPVAPHLHANLVGDAARLAADQGIAAVFFPGGDPLPTGAPLRQPALAATLRAIATDGDEVVYRGDVGAAYVRGLNRVGCPITEDDLRTHEPELGAPLTGRFRDLDVLVVPPNSQGFVLPLILAAIERLGLDPDPLGADAGTIASVFLAASEDRDRHNADPRVANVRLDALLDEGHVADVAETAVDRADRPPRTAAAPGPSHAGDTIALVTADADGRAVCLIQSLYDGFGAGILEPETGIVAHNRAACFSLDPASRNVLTPGARPAHTLMPALVTRGSEIALVPGTKGAAAQPQINAINVLRSVALGMEPLEALDAPRWIVDDTGPDGEQPVLAIEGRVPRDVRGKLAATGLPVRDLADRDGETGHAHLIAVAPDKSFTVAADPRSDGSAEAG